MKLAISIRQARRPAEIAHIRSLFEEYAAWLGVDLCFQGFAEELAGLPGKYRPPDGRLYLAKVDGQPAGSIALRRFDGESGEVKRLYVRPAFRGLGLGAALGCRVVKAAHAVGYRRLLLDTLSPMRSARKLYASLGFRPIPPYYDNPLEDVVYMELRLNSADMGPGRPA